MIRIVAGLLLLCAFALPAQAATELVEVYFLSLPEAAESARSQLSDAGKVAQVPSRRLLILEDDPEHLAAAIALLRKLDQPIAQFTATVELASQSTRQSLSAAASGQVVVGSLPGGWVQLAMHAGSGSSEQRQMQMLRITAGKPGRLESGIIRAFSRETLLWLNGYGVVRARGSEIMPITSGFTITAWPLGGAGNMIRVRIAPWMQKLEGGGRNSQMLVDLGPGRPSSPSAPQGQVPVIEIAGASTELTVPLDQTVTIAASNNEARRLGQALLGGSSSVDNREYIIKLRISR